MSLDHLNHLVMRREGANRHDLTIHVPRGYETEMDREAAGNVMVCRVIISHEDRVMCGKVFEPGRELAFERHTHKCALDHIDEIRKASPLARMPILDPNSWDPEIEAHMKDVGRRMLREGRMEMRRNERAGD